MSDLGGVDVPFGRGVQEAHNTKLEMDAEKTVHARIGPSIAWKGDTRANDGGAANEFKAFHQTSK